MIILRNVHTREQYEVTLISKKTVGNGINKYTTWKVEKDGQTFEVTSFQGWYEPR